MVSLDDDRTLASLVELQMTRTPDVTAVVDGDHELSYAQLDSRCSAIAAVLLRSGVRRGDLVAVCLPRTADLVAAVLAVHRAGAAYVPLDPAYPEDRLAYMIDDCRPRVLLVADETAALASTLLARTGATAVLNVDHDTGTAPPAAQRPEPAAPQDLAYIIYTSGSTGRPKGAMLEHRNTVAMLDWVYQEFTAADLDGVLFGTSICFDLSVFEIFATLTMGGTLIVAPHALALGDLPARNRVTLLNTVAGVTAALLRDGDLPGSVRTVIHSGDTTTRALADAIYAAPGVERFYNLYGPTEVVTWQTGLLVDRSATEEPPIGRPFPRVGVHVLDVAGEPVGIGEVGELYLSGDQVCRGYLGRPELTAEKFLHRPDLAPGTIYRTGDLVDRDDTGMLWFHGRVDFQVKIRGFRVELGEIEATLERHPAVERAVVLARRSGAGDARLLAFVQAGSLAGAESAADGLLHGAAVDLLVTELAGTTGARLPDYMQPTAVGVLARIPTTANDKPDRSALPDLPVRVASSGRAAVGTTEHALLSIWREVLGRIDIPVDLMFTALGGDSLTAAGVTSRVRQRMRLPLSLPEFQTHPTIEKLAALLDGRAVGTLPVADEVLPLDEVAPPTNALTDFWLSEQLAPDSAGWTVPLLVELSGAIDPATLQRALDEMVRRHPVLRTAMTDDHTRVRTDPCPVDLTVHDVRGLGSVGLLAAEQELDAEARRPLDLRSGRLIRAMLVHRDDERAELLIHVHHAAFDGLSNRPFLRDLARVYAALLAGSALPPPPVISFDDAARWLTSERLAHRESVAGHWAARLAGSGDLQRAPGGQLCPADVWAGGRVHRELEPAVAQQFRDFVRDHRASAFALVLASAAIRVHRETGSTDVLLVAPISSRRHPDLEDVVGLLTESALIRCDLTGAPTFGELVDRIGVAVTADLEHDPPTWHEQIGYTGGQGASLRSPGMVIAMQRGDGRITEGAAAWTYLQEMDNGGAKSDFTLSWEADMPRPQIAGEFARERYSEADAARLIDQIVTIATAGTDAPDTPIAELDWLDERDRDHLAHWSGAETARAGASSTLDQVLAATAAAPDSVAVDCPRSGAVTYRQLLDGARTVAARLVRDVDAGRAAAVAAGAAGAGSAAGTAHDLRTPIGIGTRRGALGIAGMLGAWLAGRSYLPVDVTHPPARIADVLADSGVQVLLVDDHCPPIPGTATRVELGELLGDDPSGWRTAAGSGFAAAPTDGGAAYRLYTSGSTGRPKGVTVSHAALASFLDAIGRVVPLTERDVVPYLTTPSFDISGLEIWLPLISGSRIRVVEEDTTKDGIALSRRLAGVTVAQLTPTGWQVLLAGGWQGDPGLRALVGGEAVPPALAGALLPLVGAVWNVYGPTEATIWSTVHRVTAADTTAGSVPIGRPLGNTVVQVLDAGGRQVPPGVMGEICLGGFGLADGYHRRDELTADRFVLLPWLAAGAAGPRFYRTGDLGRWRPDGTLECLGRSDGQIKIRGVRIEIGEIEAVLGAVPGVRSCAVGIDRTGGPARLVGYLVADPATDDAAVEQLARAELPPTYIPEVWVRLPELPLTPNGKVDRSALPAPDATGQDFSPPVTEAEELVADIWGDFLGTARIGRDDSFVALGGHSLLATRVCAQLRDDLDIEVPVRLLFELPRLKDFAGRLTDLIQEAT